MRSGVVITGAALVRVRSRNVSVQAKPGGRTVAATRGVFADGQHRERDALPRPRGRRRPGLHGLRGAQAGEDAARPLLLQTDPQHVAVVLHRHGRPRGAGGRGVGPGHREDRTQRDDDRREQHQHAVGTPGDRRAPGPERHHVDRRTLGMSDGRPAAVTGGCPPRRTAAHPASVLMRQHTR
ncbi:hypothetical protein GCM10010532_037150 [Dactylosporangium siamense]|uniref:Uncharacterized protein n=1 Tax=Dactylosporangium siamense TaxID=685454 RepID=A0A919PIS5_9ACTN|nr:hypothetical protein Dsi01nite_029580 [Dactylosporangium siamense]